jgi:hypothetical protein
MRAWLQGKQRTSCRSYVPSSLPQLRQDPVSPLRPKSDPSVSVCKGLVLRGWDVASLETCCWLFLVFRSVCFPQQCHMG